MAKKKFKQVVVLADGVTYMDVQGSRLVSIPVTEMKAAEEDGTADELVEAYYKEGVEISTLAKRKQK